MQTMDEAGKVPIAWWRFLLMTALFTGLYLAIRSIVTPPQTHPVVLLPTVLLGAVLGALTAKWQESARDDRRNRRGHRRSTSEARWYLFGLAGLGLLLSRWFPATSLEWLAVGLVALTTGGASHAWVTAAHHERDAQAS